MKNLTNSKSSVLNYENSVKCPSPSNRLLEKLKITDSDCYIAEYIDFLSFYGKYLPEVLVLWCRDNDAGTNYFGFHISRWNEGKWYKNIILKIIYYYEWKLVDIWQLNEFTKDWKRLLRVQLYGKGILVINRENLWRNLENLLFFFGMNDITLTRTDYAIDCEKINFEKRNSLKAKKAGQFHDARTGELEYLGFWAKGKSPLFIRYYDKKKDLERTKFEWLYPEYQRYSTIMRYELQVNSDGISPDHKNKTVYDLEKIANFWQEIWKNKRSHKRYVVADRDFRVVEGIVKKYRDTGNKGQLSRLLMLLESMQLK